jgi:ABC-type phosphate transport system substrate-binding protein
VGDDDAATAAAAADEAADDEAEPAAAAAAAAESDDEAALPVWADTIASPKTTLAMPGFVVVNGRKHSINKNIPPITNFFNIFIFFVSTIKTKGK